VYLRDLPSKVMWALQDMLEADCKSFFEEKFRGIPGSLEERSFSSSFLVVV